MSEEEVLSETEEEITINLGRAEWKTLDDTYYVMEKDFKVQGEVWRVHKYDADPFPSDPHAHCIGGRDRFIGCKLHLGTAELYHANNTSYERRLERKQFLRLCELVAKKFPHLTFPLPVS